MAALLVLPIIGIAKKLKNSDSNSSASSTSGSDVATLQSRLNAIETALIAMSPQLAPLTAQGSPTWNGQVAEAEQLLRATTQRCHAFISSALTSPQPAPSSGGRGIRGRLRSKSNSSASTGSHADASVMIAALEADWARLNQLVPHTGIEASTHVQSAPPAYTAQ